MQAAPIASPAPRRHPSRRQTVYTIEQRLDVGARVAAWRDDHPDVRRMCWAALARDVFHQTPTKAVTMRLKRSWHEWQLHSEHGSHTNVAAGAEHRALRRRKDDNAHDTRRRDGEWIGFELLQWFVDEIEAIKGRADSRLMMDHARWLRSQLVASGVQDALLPKINKSWLFRWRRFFGISIRRGTTTFQVSWYKVVTRVRVMLGNMFRLRRLWALCHPGVPMRWLSADQKPSWMNNAGRRPMYARKGSRAVGAKENHAATRNRYTILTFVPSWASAGPEPPPVAVLFKAAGGGARLARELEVPPWMKLQFQEKGSYRADDVVEAIQWALPQAANSSESIVVMLDWFSAHLSAEVADAVRGLGHVLLYHGGGVTGLQQINDTHLHAVVQRMMEQLETAAMHRLRQADPQKIASFQRQDVLDIVAEMWQGIDHANVRQKGYAQTGPTLPDDATIDDLFVDLRPVWEHIDGQALRQQAIQDVNDQWAAGILQSWADAENIIEHHTPHPEVQEGLEGVDWEIVSDEDEDDGNDSNDEHGFGNDDDDDDGPPPPGGGSVSSASAASVDASASSSSAAAPAAGSMAGGGPPGDPGASGGPCSGASASSCLGASASSCISRDDGPRDFVEADIVTADSSGPTDVGVACGGLCDDPAYLTALKHVAKVARNTRNDQFLRVVLRELRKSSQKRLAGQSDQAAMLRDAAREEREKVAKARAERKELERKAALDDAVAKTALEDAKKQAAIARREALEASSAIRREELQRREALATQRRKARWLQTSFPVELARRLLAWRRGLEPETIASLAKAVRGIELTSRCLRDTQVPQLWDDDKSLTTASCYALMPGPGGRRAQVRCTTDFEWILFGEAWANKRAPDAGDALRKLLDRICPHASCLFARRYTPSVVMEACDYIAPKAFVHAVILLSKWLGEARFPLGVFAWPPAMPADTGSAGVA